MGWLALLGLLASVQKVSSQIDARNAIIHHAEASRGESLSDVITIATYNIRTASQWAVRDGGDGYNGRTWPARRNAVSKTIQISGAAVVGTQEGLAWQLDDLLSLLGPTWHRVGVGRYNGTRDAGGDEDELAAILFDKSRVAVGDAGDFWLSDSPAHSSKAWGASLPRVATWARFTTVLNGMPLKQHEFVVLNAHLDHASETARVESARLLRTKAHELSQKSQCNKETGLGSEDSKHGRSSDSSDSSDSSSSCSTSVVFVMGDFNAVKDEGGKRGWYAQLTADASKNSDSDSTPPLIDAWAQASERNCGACSQSTFHAWRGSSEPSPNWLAPYFGHRSLEIAASGARHIDGVFVTQSAVVKAEKSREVSSDAPTSTDATGAEEQEDARESRRDGDPDDSPHGTILKAKLVTDDKRRRNSRYGQPFASDHYPVVVTYQWFRQDGEGARNGLIDRPGVNSGTGYEL